MTPEQTEACANDWLPAGNAHDLDRILSHYEEDVEMSSPVIRHTMGAPGRLVPAVSRDQTAVEGSRPVQTILM